MSQCNCRACIQTRGDTVGGMPRLGAEMILCPTCGNKRCPHANDHRHACTGSNEPGQQGSADPKISEISMPDLKTVTFDATLKPCPFCGGTSITTDVTQTDADRWICSIDCGDCDSSMRPVYDSKSDSEAAADARQLWNTRAPTPAAQRAGQEAADLQRVYDAFGIGSQARDIGTLMISIGNVIRFADYLHAIERESFMVPGEPYDDYPDDQPADECLLNCWGSTQEQYIEQFRAAIPHLNAAPANGGERKCKCDMRTRLVGDGCDVCNPELARELSERAADAPQVSGRMINWDSASTVLNKWLEKNHSSFEAECELFRELAALSSPAKVGGDEREIFESRLGRGKTYTEREFTMWVDGLHIGRAALSADGGERKPAGC